MKYLMIINGQPRSGKDTFIDMCIKRLKKKYNRVGIKLSSVDRVKEIAVTLGWDGEKTAQSRLMLSDLKDFCDKHFDLSFNELNKTYESMEDESVLFYMEREPKNIERILNEYSDIKRYSVLIDRGLKNALIHHGNHADDEILNHNYHIRIKNNGDINDLKQEVKIFLKRRFDYKKEK